MNMARWVPDMDRLDTTDPISVEEHVRSMERRGEFGGLALSLLILRIVGDTHAQDRYALCAAAWFSVRKRYGLAAAVEDVLYSARSGVASPRASYCAFYSSGVVLDIKEIRHFPDDDSPAPPNTPLSDTRKVTDSAD